MKANEKREQRRAAIQSYEECEEQLDPVLDSLRELDSRLDVGLTQSEYSEVLGDASVARGEVDVEDLSEGCVEVYEQLDDIIVTYSDVGSAWEDCIFDSDCDPDDESINWSVDWGEASEMISGTEADLRALDPRQSSESS